MFVATWTAEQIATLHRMNRDGASARDIAKALKKTRNAVLGKLLRERGRKSPPKPKPRMTHYTRDMLLAVPVNQSKPPMRLDATPHDALPPDAPGLVLMEDLRAGMCRFPLNNALHGVYFFCGEPAMPLRSYCAAHNARCYVKKKEGQDNVSL